MKAAAAAPPQGEGGGEAAGASGVAVKVAGALKGVVRVSSLDAPTSELRAEAARLLGVDNASTVKLIAGGRTLQEDARPLRQYGLTAASRVLVTKGAAAQAALGAAQAAQAAEDARAAQLDRLRAALEAMAARDGRGLTDKFEFSLENQDGARLALSDADRRALVMGLALHEKGKASLEARDYKAALDVLLMAEESFGVATPPLLEGVDNVALLLLDIVWCCYKLRDVGRLGVCSERLASARRMLQRAHGAHQERLRLLHGNFSPEQAIYLRLELLEGVVAFHSGDPAAAQQHLAAAQARWQRLQLSEAALLHLAEMGYDGRESSRALRFAGGDLAAAVNFLTEQRERGEERRREERKQRRWLRDRMALGKTPSGKYVDPELLAQLEGQLGYERAAAAEALRQADNDVQAALDVLGDPVRRGALQLGLIAEQMLEQDKGPQWVNGAHVAKLVGEGFLEKPARVALAAAANNYGKALRRLQAQSHAVRSSGPAGGGEEAPAAAPAGGGEEAPAEAAGPPGAPRRRRLPEEQGDGDGAAGGGSSSGSSSGGGGRRADGDMEADLAASVSRSKDDPLSAYDIDVGEDGEAIAHYLGLLRGGGEASGGGQPGGGGGGLG